jgi:colanic acid biosynthesis glycosyl transferase WcaI
VRLSASSEDPLRAERATENSSRFNFAAAMADYCGLIRELSQTPD